MAKKVKKEKDSTTVAALPEGLKCYQKSGGGSHRFYNRIIKPGQKFWINPNSIPASMVDVFKEVAADKTAVIVYSTNAPIISNEQEITNVEEKFELVVAVDEDGLPLKKGSDKLYNVIDEGGKPMNDKPLRKGKADELLSALNA